MLNVKNLKIIFLALLLAVAMPVLCMAGGKGNHGTRVNTGLHADFTGSGGLRLIVQYLNPSNNPITIKEIRVYRPDGTLASPNFPLDSFPVPPFDLGPFESKGFALIATGVQPVTFVPRGAFQVFADWESDRATNGLKGFSVVIGFDPSGSTGRMVVEGFDLKTKKNKGNDDDGSSSD